MEKYTAKELADLKAFTEKLFECVGEDRSIEDVLGKVDRLSPGAEDPEPESFW